MTDIDRAPKTELAVERNPLQDQAMALRVELASGTAGGMMGGVVGVAKCLKVVEGTEAALHFNMASIFGSAVLGTAIGVGIGFGIDELSNHHDL